MNFKKLEANNFSFKFFVKIDRKINHQFQMLVFHFLDRFSSYKEIVVYRSILRSHRRNEISSTLSVERPSGVDLWERSIRNESSVMYLANTGGNLEGRAILKYLRAGYSRCKTAS